MWYIFEDPEEEIVFKSPVLVYEFKGELCDKT